MNIRKDPAPPCRTREDIASYSGTDVCLQGTYRRLSLSRRPRPVSAADRHAGIILNDGTEVLLEPSWSDRSLRSEEEILRFDGEAVVVRGVVLAEAPAPVDPVAYVVGPCITSIDEIRLMPDATGGAE